MATRKRLSWKTKCAAALLMNSTFKLATYKEAKEIPEDEWLGRWEWDHNIYHESGHPDRDKYWNITPMPVLAHSEKTKRDIAIIAKGRRIRRKHRALNEAAMENMLVELHHTIVNTRGARKLRSRGFDKRFTRKMSGKVVPRTKVIDP